MTCAASSSMSSKTLFAQNAITWKESRRLNCWIRLLMAVWYSGASSWMFFSKRLAMLKRLFRQLSSGVRRRMAASTGRSATSLDWKRF